MGTIRVALFLMSWIVTIGTLVYILYNEFYSAIHYEYPSKYVILLCGIVFVMIITWVGERFE